MPRDTRRLIGRMIGEFAVKMAVGVVFLVWLKYTCFTPAINLGP